MLSNSVYDTIRLGLDNASVLIGRLRDKPRGTSRDRELYAVLKLLGMTCKEAAHNVALALLNYEDEGGVPS